MTDQTIVAQNAPQEQPAPARAKQPRQMVRFTFYKLDPQWQMLPPEQRQQGKQQLLQIVEEHGGSVRAGNHEQGGAAFTLRLPLEQALSAA